MLPINPLKIRYTLINSIYQDSIFSIDRIEVFQDSINTIVAGIGKMYYGEPPYAKKIWGPTGVQEQLCDPTEYYLDFLCYTL